MRSMKITPKQAEVIEAIELGHTAMSELRDYLGLSNNTVFGSIKRLRAKGLVKTIRVSEGQIRQRYIYTGKAFTVEEFFKLDEKGEKEAKVVKAKPAYPALDLFNARAA